MEEPTDGMMFLPTRQRPALTGPIQDEEIYVFQNDVADRLMAWASLSVFSGIFLGLSGSAFWKGLASQMIGWGAIDGLIAHFSSKGTAERISEPDAFQPEKLAQQRRFLSLALWINAGLDVLYILFGLRAARQQKPYQRGIGWGIVIQGLFLLFFDVIHGLMLSAGPRRPQ